MFGDFLQNFNLQFPLQGADAQGGLFGQNAPTQDQPPLGGPAAPGGAGTGLNMAQPASGAGKAPPSVTAPPSGGNNLQPVAPPAATAPPAPSPLASPLAPGGGSGFQGQPQNDPAPAAGVGNQFTNGKAGF
jgi:hypothetical protein